MESNERKTALEVWQGLEKEYQIKSLSNSIYLKQKYSCFKFEENKSIDENLDVFLKLISDLGSLNIHFTDED